MILVEQGFIKLDDTLDHHIKDAPKRWKDITIRNLLTHTFSEKWVHTQAFDRFKMPVLS